MIEIIDSVYDKKVLNSAIKRFKEKNIILPKFSEMKNPENIPEKVKTKLKGIGMWDLHPLNLFRITWKNDPVLKGGGFGKVNYIELPSSLTGVKARIILLIGKYFPTGAHKVGAAYGCLAPRIISGRFDPAYNKAVWPSTGNYCRGGAFDSYLMGCDSIAILPEEMSRERFTWLEDIGSEVIATPGSESNVKEIYDKCWELKENRDDVTIFNQFDEFGNPAWHYSITGSAFEEVFDYIKSKNSVLAAYVSATGSAGTIAAGDYLKTKFPLMKTVASEALQCPTLMNNGFGAHRIEGIGDKHVPWVHNVKNTDVVTAIDDEDCMRILRLFNEEDGKKLLKNEGINSELVDNLGLLGISSISNLLSAIKTAKYYEMTEDDVIISLATDSAEMYESRIKELSEERGEYNEIQAAKDFERCILGVKYDNFKELTYTDRKAIHNLKYFTWVEQQQKDIEDLNILWKDRDIWNNIFNQVDKWDEMIEDFNERTGVLRSM